MISDRMATADEISREAHKSIAAIKEHNRAAALERELQGYNIAIQKVELEYQAVMDGTHHELHFRCAGLKRRRYQMKADAKHNLASKEGLVQKLMDYEKEQIEECYNSAVGKVREKMDSDLAAQIRVLQQRRDGKEGDESRMSTRSLRSKKGASRGGDEDDDDDDEGMDRSSTLGNGNVGLGSISMNSTASFAAKETADANNRRRTKRALSPASLHLDKCLDEDEINDDKYAIERDAEMQRRAAVMLQSGSIKGGAGGSANRKRAGGSGASGGTGSKKSSSQNTSSRSSRTGESETSSSSSAILGDYFVQVDIKQGQLQYEQDLFLKGDPVFAQVLIPDGKHAANSTISGIISSINNSEVHLRLPEGTKHRVYLSHLRNGRSILKHDNSTRLESKKE